MRENPPRITPPAEQPEQQRTMPAQASVKETEVDAFGIDIDGSASPNSSLTESHEESLQEEPVRETFFDPSSAMVEEIRALTIRDGMYGRLPLSYEMVLSSVRAHEPAVFDSLDANRESRIYQDELAQLTEWIQNDDLNKEIPDSLVETLPPHVLHTMVGAVLLQQSNNPEVSTSIRAAKKLEYIQARAKERQSSENGDAGQPLSSFDTILSLIGNPDTEYQGNMLSLVDSVLTKDSYAFADSVVYGKDTFFMRDLQGHLVLVPKEGDETEFGDDVTRRNLESRVYGLLSYGRGKGIVSINDRAIETLKPQLTKQFKERILFGEKMSPYFGEVAVDQPKLPSVLQPLYTGDFGNASSTDFRLRVEFDEPFSTGGSDTSRKLNEEVAERTASALSRLILEGYPIGFKVSRGDFKDSAVVMYVAPFAVDKVIDTLIEEGVFHPENLQMQAMKDSISHSYQHSEPFNVNIRRSTEEDFSEKGLKTMDDFLKFKLRSKINSGSV